MKQEHRITVSAEQAPETIPPLTKRHGATLRLTPEELEACRKDPAWEARHGIADRVVCRVYGATPQFPLSGKKGHLWVRHRMSTKEYKAAYPGARLSSFRRIARMAIGRPGRCRDVSKLMAAWAEHYLRPEELDLYRQEPGRETRLGISDYVVCRVCGAKIRTTLSGSRHDHLLAEHGLNLQQYRKLWPAAPRSSAENAKAVSRASRRWAKNHPNETKSYQSRYGKKLEIREKRRTYSRHYAREVRAFAKIGRQRVLAQQAQQQPAKRGRKREDDVADRVIQLKTSLSWAQLTIKMNAEALRSGSKERTEEGYRSLYRSRKQTLAATG